MKRRKNGHATLVASGKVKRAFGIKGEVNVLWNNGACPVDAGKGSVYIRAAGGDLEELMVEKERGHAGGRIVKFRGIDSRTDAERLKGGEVFVAKNALRKLPAGEYYAFQLIGMKVVSAADGEYLGEISAIFPTGSNDVYVVKDGLKELLLPATEDVVAEVDVEGGVMRVNLIEGLR